MRHLQKNWDGYGAATQQPTTIELAGEFVTLLEMLLRKRGGEPAGLHVCPTRLGGELIE